MRTKLKEAAQTYNVTVLRLHGIATQFTNFPMSKESKYKIENIVEEILENLARKYKEKKSDILNIPISEVIVRQRTHKPFKGFRNSKENSLCLK